MEDLTKTQLILLALLVSFITSIATGIVTITLLDQAPPGVTQTINRVVERTVEKVVPGQTASVITKETTVVVKEENLIVEAVDKNSKNIVRVGLADDKGLWHKTLGIGFLVSTDGFVLTDSLNLTDSKEYLMKTQGGKTYSAVLEKVDQSSTLALLKIKKPENNTEEVFKFPRSNFADTSNLKLGQTVIAIGGLKEDTVLTGIVSRLEKKPVEVPKEEDKTGNNKDLEEPKTETLVSIKSNIILSSDYSGGPLINIDGFLLGINLQRKDGSFSVPVNVIVDILSKTSDNKEKAGEGE